MISTKFGGIYVYNVSDCFRTNTGKPMNAAAELFMNFWWEWSFSYWVWMSDIYIKIK